MAEAPVKECSRCQQEKSPAAFNKCTGKKDGLQAMCRECQSEYHKMRTYGVSQKDFDAMLVKQKNKCALCEIKFRSRDYNGPICIDHKHHDDPEVEKLRVGKTRVRGLLCHQCNVSLGLVRDDRGTLLRMVDYLTTHSTQEELEDDEESVSDQLTDLMKRLRVEAKK
jgi:hypothetical protein